MRAVTYFNAQPHQQDLGAAMAEGLKLHGIEVHQGRLNEPEPCDFAVLWGYKQHRVIKDAPHVLVMERGHVGDRMAMTSCGWDGLARRGRYPKAPNGDRWLTKYRELMRPWRRGEGYALIVGQVPDDAAVGGLDISKWATLTALLLKRKGWKSRFRPHPLAPSMPTPEGTTLIRGKLEDALKGAGLCVTFNSTVGVEAVLVGVPTVTLDAGAMAWPVASHDLNDPPVIVNRTEWAWDLAWTQWSREELASGEAWAHLKPVMDA